MTATNFTELKTKTARVSFIKSQLKTNVQWAQRGLVRIYEHQTEDEKQADTTRHWNRVGFSGADAEILSSFARQVIAGRHLSAKQLEILHKRIPKYAGQLEKLAK